jgi:hypothetical protein
MTEPTINGEYAQGPEIVGGRGLTIASRRDNPECRSLDQVVTSQPMSIMVLMQSSGKYDIHRKMFSSERATSASLIHVWTGIVATGGSQKTSTKTRCGT